MLVTVDHGIRMRSQPRVAEDSTKYEPLLPRNTQLHALEGPLAESGYWWYRVELADPRQSLFGGVREGWVAAADRDGTAWLDWYVDVDPAPPGPEPWLAWPGVLRDGVRRGATTDQQGNLVGPVDDQGRLVIPIEITGLLPGTQVAISGRARYAIGWMCEYPDPSSDLGGGIVDAGETTGVAEESADLEVGPDGIGRLTVPLAPSKPPQPCPTGSGPYATRIRWSEIRVADFDRGLVLTPDDVTSGVTF
jgi:hypothetical protein